MMYAVAVLAGVILGWVLGGKFAVRACWAEFIWSMGKTGADQNVIDKLARAYQRGLHQAGLRKLKGGVSYPKEEI